MLFIMYVKDRPGTAEQRAAVRPVHLDHLTSLGEKLVLGGALMGPDGPEGSMLVLEADSLEAATAAFMRDPFFAEGIFGTPDIKPWRVAFNHTGREI